MIARPIRERLVLWGAGAACGAALHALGCAAYAAWTSQASSSDSASSSSSFSSHATDEPEMRWNDIDADLTLSGGSTKIACPIEVVKAFLLAQSCRDLDAICNLVAEDIIYINEPHPPEYTIRGKTMFREAFAASACMRCIKADLTTLKFARNGSLVFVERIDNFLINGTWLRIPICGYFKVCQGKIEFWKDYWDYCRYKEFVRNTFGKGASMRAALAQDQIVKPSASAS